MRSLFLVSSALEKRFFSKKIFRKSTFNTSFSSFKRDKLVTQKVMKDHLNVLEIKFDYKDLNDVHEILEKIQLKPKRFSKYLRGLSFFNSTIYI